MTFLADPCPCGWSFTYITETERECEQCGRVSVKNWWGWTIEKSQIAVALLMDAGLYRKRD